MRTRPPPCFTSNTHRSVMMRLTTPKPVMGSVHFFKIFGLPSFEVCSITATTRFTPATRSIAPPGPLTILPGIIQFAMSPLSVTSNAPRIARSMWPPRIIVNESALEKKAEPGIVVMVCLPALIKSASTSSSVGNGPMPSRPFSDCNVTFMPSGM